MECVICKATLDDNDFDLCKNCLSKYGLDDEEPRFQKIRRHKGRGNDDLGDD